MDGQQLLLTLKYFTEGMIRDKSFRLTEVADPWNGKLFKELDEQDQSLLEESTIHVTYFKQDSPKENDRSIYRSEEHTSDLPSLMRISYAAFCLNKTPNNKIHNHITSYN